MTNLALKGVSSYTTSGDTTAKRAESPYKLYDSEGLFLLVTPSGGKIWRFRFKAGGKEKLLSIGAYPKPGLPAARKQRNAAIEKLQAGVDPAAALGEEISSRRG